MWLTASDGEYDVQKQNESPRNLCGIFRSDERGWFSFKCIRPTEYKVPEDGPGGDLLRYCGRHPWRPAHIHFVISAPGFEKVTTHLFCRGDRYVPRCGPNRGSDPIKVAHNLHIRGAWCAKLERRYLYEDAVFAVIDSLVLDWPDLNDEAEAERLGFSKLPYCKVHHDFKLARAQNP